MGLPYKHSIEGHKEEEIKGKGRQGRRRNQLLLDFN
jgi:hypothetical protein